MKSSSDQIAEQLASIPYVDASTIGTYVEQNGTQAVVDVGQARVTMPMIGQYFPVPGEPVRLLRVDKQTFLLGPAVPKSPTGMVAATGSPRCAVEYPVGSGVMKMMGYPSNISPAVGQLVLIDWTSGGTVIDVITATPTYAPPGVAPGGGGGSQQQRQVFTAGDSASFGSRWFTNDVYASASNIGAWFYGTKIADTIPNGATILGAAIYLPIRQSSGSAPNLGVHSSATRPGGSVSFVASGALNPRSGWVGIPTSYIDYLKSNAGGMGMNHGGYNIYAGVGSDGMSGALDIIWI